MFPLTSQKVELKFNLVRTKPLVTCYSMLFMTLEQKYRWVKDWNRTPEPDQSIFDVVVLRESARVALTYAALNELPICACDSQNDYLQASSSDKNYVVCGLEFGLENVGKCATIVRDLHDGKSSEANYWRHTRSTMEDMGFTCCNVNPDVWFQTSLKANGF